MKIGLASVWFIIYYFLANAQQNVSHSGIMASNVLYLVTVQILMPLLVFVFYIDSNFKFEPLFTSSKDQQLFNRQQMNILKNIDIQHIWNTTLNYDTQPGIYNYCI